MYDKDNDLLKRLTALLSGAGFLIKGFFHQGSSACLVVRPSDSYEPDSASGTEKENTSVPAKKQDCCIGEKRNLARLLGATDWRHAFSLVQELIRSGGDTTVVNLGDFIRVKFHVPAASYQGVDFKALSVDAEVRVLEVDNYKVVFNFDEILFRSAINAKDTNKGGLAASALGEYLNKEFAEAMGISNVLIPNGDGLRFSLPTATEVFGDEDYWESSSNWDEEPDQLGFFRKIKNRIKVWEDDTSWWWTASPRASSAAYFCFCNSYGISINISASSVGGVAPAFCVA